MYIKKFEAPTLIQAVEKVRSELGADAVILSTRSIKSPGLLPWFRKPRFEVIAAKDAEVGEHGSLSKSVSSPGGSRQFSGAESGNSQAARRTGLDLVISEPVVRQASDKPASPPADIKLVRPVNAEVQAGRSESEDKHGHEAVSNEKPAVVNPIKAVEQVASASDESEPAPSEASAPVSETGMEMVMAELAKLKAQITQNPQPQMVIPQTSSDSVRFEGLVYLERVLKDKALGSDSVEKILNRCINDTSGSELRDPVRSYERGRECLNVILSESRDWGDIDSNGPKRMVFIGPTGVGKTTTIAKLAARYSLLQNKSVALIAADTYRIAAVSQLKMYGELMGIEVDVVHNAQEMASVIEKRQDRDVVLIDTAGRSPRNKPSLEALKSLLDAARPTETHLVLSVTTKAADFIDILTRFEPLDYDRLLFTKLDESDQFGEMVEVILSSDYPVSFLSNGQNVPNDIEIASAERVSSLLLPAHLSISALH